MDAGHGHGHGHEDEELAGASDLAGQVKRRSALKLLGAAAAVTAVGPGHFRPLARSHVRPQAGAVDVVPMAMHIHSSFSEGDFETNQRQASMELQAQTAVAAGLSALWYTDHDWRIGAVGMPTALGLSSLAESVSGGVWAWDVQRTGALSASNVAAVTSPVYPGDPTAGALRVTTTAQSTGAGATLLYANTERVRQAQRATVAGMTLQLAVLAKQSGADAWAELRLVLSNRPPAGGRPAGQYRLTYQISAAGSTGRTVTGNAAVVRRQVPLGSWSLQSFDIVADVRACWPDLGSLAQDNGLFDMWIGVAVRNGAAGDFVFDHLRFNRSLGARGALALQRSLMASIQAKYPSVRLFQGLEVSLYADHLNWYMPSAITSIPSYPPGRVTGGAAPPGFNAAAIRRAHAGGGLASLNHAFGVGDDHFLSPAQQVAKRRTIAAKLLGAKAYGADLLEVAYQIRGYVDLETHLDLAVVLAQSGNFLTWSGASDDHAGGIDVWNTSDNRFVCCAWAAGNNFTALTGAMRAGRLFPRQLGSYGGALDLLVDGRVPMGAVSVDGATTRSLRVTATDLPTGGAVEIRQLPMTFDNRVDPAPAILNQVVSAAAVTGGTVDLDLDTSQASLAFALVRNAGGTVVGLTNPVWLLRSAPPAGIPVARQAD